MQVKVGEDVSRGIKIFPLLERPGADISHLVVRALDMKGKQG